MRYVFLFLVTIVLASCGNHKMRFAKTTKKQQRVVEIADVPVLKEEATSSDNSNTFSSEEISPNVPGADERAELTLEQDIPVYMEVPSVYDNPEDSTVVSRQEAEEIKDEAMWAEKRGKLSLTFSLLTPLLLLGGGLLLIVGIYGGLGPAGIAFSLVLLGLAVASIVLSFVFGIQSLNAQYNTQKGRKKAIMGVIISSSFLGLFLMNIVFGLL